VVVILESDLSCSVAHSNNLKDGAIPCVVEMSCTALAG
jgi:hypothetical protein